MQLTDRMRIRFRVSDTLGNILIVAGMDNFDVDDRLFSGVQSEIAPMIAPNIITSVAPNPIHKTTDVTVHSSGGRLRIEVISPLGQTLSVPFNTYTAPGEQHIPITLDLPDGWYIIRVTDGHYSESERVVVQ